MTSTFSLTQVFFCVRDEYLELVEEEQRVGEEVDAEAREHPEDVDQAAEVGRHQAFVRGLAHEEQTAHLEDAAHDAADDQILEVVRDVLHGRGPHAFVALHHAEPLLELDGDRGHAVADGVDHRQREVDAEENEEDRETRHFRAARLERDDADGAQTDVERGGEQDVALDAVVEHGVLVGQVPEDRLEHPGQVQQRAVLVCLHVVLARHELREGAVDQLRERAVAGERQVVVLVGPGHRRVPDFLLHLRYFGDLPQPAAQQVFELRAFRAPLPGVHRRDRGVHRVVARRPVCISIHRINYRLSAQSLIRRPCSALSGASRSFSTMNCLTPVQSLFILGSSGTAKLHDRYTGCCRALPRSRAATQRLAERLDGVRVGR